MRNNRLVPLLGLVTVSSGLLPSPAGAKSTEIVDKGPDQVVVRSSATYRMGEGDSQVEAKKLAVEKAKQKAIERAGTYVQQTTEVSQGRVADESVRAIAAGLVQTRILDTAIKTAGNQLRYNATIRATVDQEGLEAQISDLISQEKKESQIQKLKGQNEDLRQRLAELNQRIRKSGKRAEPLTEERAEVLTRIDDNRHRIRKTLEEGTLLDLADRGEDRWEQITSKLETFFWPRLRDSAEIEIERIHAQRNGHGTSDVSVQIRTGLQKDKAFDWLKKHLRVQDPSDTEPEISSAIYSIPEYNNEEEEQKTPFSEKLLRHLEDEVIRVAVKIGDKTQNIALSGNFCGFFGKTHCFVKSRTDEVQFASIPNDQLRTATGVEAEVVLP